MSRRWPVSADVIRQRRELMAAYPNAISHERFEYLVSKLGNAPLVDAYYDEHQLRNLGNFTIARVQRTLIVSVHAYSTVHRYDDEPDVVRWWFVIRFVVTENSTGDDLRRHVLNGVHADNLMKAVVEGDWFNLFQGNPRDSQRTRNRNMDVYKDLVKWGFLVQNQIGSEAGKGFVYLLMRFDPLQSSRSFPPAAGPAT